MPGTTPRMTLATQLVLHALLEDPTTERYGLDLGQHAGLASGTIHPILARLEAAGWLTSRWEDIDPRTAGRPARRFYRLTEHGTTRAHAALTTASRRHRTRLIPGLTPETRPS